MSVEFIGNVGDIISVYNAYNDSTYAGLITALTSPAMVITTDIPWEANFDATYFNDNTLYGGFYFEGRLKVNDVIQELTVIASPDSFGQADVDVSGILRIKTSLGKTGDYSETIMAEPTKGGKFTFAYRPCWYGSDEAYTEEGNTWYYAECVRSIEQGSNLYEYLFTETGDVPFLNSFERPVYFKGMPFDISFVCPYFGDSPQLRVVIKTYSANNTYLGLFSQYIDVEGLEGKVCSVNVAPENIDADADHFTIEIQLNG
jgi:hypothetical protein